MRLHSVQANLKSLSCDIYGYTTIKWLKMQYPGFFMIIWYTSLTHAGVAELVYARDSKSRLARDGGSSPLSGTLTNSLDCLFFRLKF